MDVLQRDAAHSHLLRSSTSVCACAQAPVRVWSVLTAQCNDVAAVFVDKLLRHCLLHDLLHLHTQKGNREREPLPSK